MELSSVDQIPAKPGDVFYIYYHHDGMERMMTYQFDGLCYQAGAGGYYTAEQLFDHWTNNPCKAVAHVVILRKE